MGKQTFPPGWDAKRMPRVSAQYEAQGDDEAVAEDEAAFDAAGQTIIVVPTELVPRIRALIAKHRGGRPK